MKALFWSAALAALFVSACGDTEVVPASQLGAKLFSDPKVSTSPFNTYACATCHIVAPPAEESLRRAERLDPGYNLYDTVQRPSWWGGDKTRLLDAINTCIFQFMGGRTLQAAEDPARQLYEYLAVNSGGAPAPALPLTVARLIGPLGEVAGDAANGKALYQRSCFRCHGDAKTGAGAPDGRAGIIPLRTTVVFGARAREAVVEKIRHGRFFGIGGVMPPYSLETLSDVEVASILAHLEL
ncbi:MAG TPA: c-type cytochrome [Polyangia bacterium]